MGFLDSLWNVFNPSTAQRPALERPVYQPNTLVFFGGSNSESIVSSIYSRIASDCAAVSFKHSKVDENGQPLRTVYSGLNHCLSVSANIDQTGRALIRDAVKMMLHEGHAVIVPVDIMYSRMGDGFRVDSLRVGKVTQWYPHSVTVDLYNDRTGEHQEVTVPKEDVAIVENPHYGVMNEPNSTLDRLKRKLQLLDKSDEDSCSGKLDLIIQLPYVIKSDARKQQADARRKDIEMQLSGSKYGIAYTDGTEKITQLNRSIDNNLQSQVEYLTKQLYTQMGISQAVLDGTGDNKALLDYYDRTIEPILQAIAEEIDRKILRRSLGRSFHRDRITFSKDPFKLIPVTEIADISDKLTRNAILTPNEVRGILGFAPSEEPDADTLRNRNMPDDLAGGYQNET